MHSTRAGYSLATPDFGPKNGVHLNLKSKPNSFINYFNATLAKPFSWTYTGKPLKA
ncbi:MAG: hypothetical protein GY811_10375 [Myxococcales bacterium]|nr:hypothetical protein [Myxococcales bacterium]